MAAKAKTDEKEEKGQAEEKGQTDAVLSEAATEAAGMDETVPGGCYEIGGIPYNANGEPIESK